MRGVSRRGFLKCAVAAMIPGARAANHAWRTGHYQVHHIYTGRSECMFHIFPDGTSMLLDCGDTMRFYKTAGDFSDGWKHPDGVRCKIEDALAEAVGAVHVAKLNHHGHHAMSPKLVKSLQARVWTCCSLDQQHCTDDTMARLADRSLYGGPRLMLPTYMPLARPATPAGRGYLPDVDRCVIDQPCHVVLDVPPGGESYTLSCLSATKVGNPLGGEFDFVAN